jgi:hypothetical protein
MKTKNTISDVLARLVVDVDNMNAFLLSLEKMLESKSENVTISQTLEDGSVANINVPSFGYLKGKIDNVSTNFETLISANDDVIGIKSSNGDVRKFELKKISKLVQDLESVSQKTVTVPTEFGVKNNWFFESFLNPLLFVSLDVSQMLSDDIDQFLVKRIIINTVDDDDIQYFSDNYINNNEIALEELKLDLEEQGIDYFEDDNVVQMDVSINRYKGSFDVLRILEEEVEDTIISTGEQITISRRRYKLSTLNYTDVLSDTQNTRILAEGDVLITDKDSEYKVTSVNRTDNEVLLERIFGTDPVTIGADIFRIKPVKYREPELQVNVGYNEREVIFVRPISKANNLTVDSYSKGFALFTNDLTIQLEDDSTSTLEQYYNNFVSDFGMILLSAAKEKKLPAILAESPNAPVLDVESFKVVQVDQHIKEDEGEIEIKNQIAEKENLKVRIKENIKQIDNLKAQLNDAQKTRPEKNRIEKKIKSSIDQRASLQTQLGSTVRDLSVKLSTNAVYNRAPKYKVRGFWPIPEAKSNTYGKQEIVQFKVRYRYLSKKGNAQNADSTKIIGEDGSETFATFSPWTEVLTKSRTRQLDEELGLYTWSTEDLSNADAVNSNQIEIPIRKGEIVEVQVKSLSEAGWPDNPAESDWSESIQVNFPEEIESVEEATIASQKLYAEEARLDFEDELNSRGLDLHLQNQFTTGERFFSHQSRDIASGFFTSEGNIIDLFEKLSSLQNTIDSLQQSIATEKGSIKVSLIDDQGNETEVKNGDTVNLFAGYYRDQIKDTSGTSVIYNEGKIITKQYVIQIQNTSATALELISTLKGGIGQAPIESDPIAYPDSDYHVNRRYDLIPLGINSKSSGDKSGILQSAGFQSSQVQGQWIHERIKDYGLANDLHQSPNTSGNGSVTNQDANAYDGVLIGGELVPFNNGSLVPFRPGWDGGGIWTTDSNVWNGIVSSGVPGDGGYLNEFCLHKNHPILLNSSYANIDASANSVDRQGLFAPYDPVSLNQDYLNIAHAPFIETSESENIGILGNSYKSQAKYITPGIETVEANTNNTHFPIKLGFKPSDEWLIGKYTCGSYLYMFPNAIEDIAVEGNHPDLSTKKVQTGDTNAINIPVLFQYRCSDKLGNVGGYRTNENLLNIKYQKKIGIDIFVKEDSPFSFDIDVSVQYKKETTLDSPIVPSRGPVSVNF